MRAVVEVGRWPVGESGVAAMFLGRKGSDNWQEDMEKTLHLAMDSEQYDIPDPGLRCYPVILALERGGGGGSRGRGEGGGRGGGGSLVV